MAITFIKNHPRLTYLLIGFGLGAVLAGVNDHWAQQTISEYQSRLRVVETKYEEVVATSSMEIATLSKINENLRTNTKKSKVTLPDGTITEKEEEVLDSTKTSEISIQQKLELQYEKKLSVQREKHLEEINKLEQKKLRLGIGYTTDLEYYGHGSYNILGPISIGGGATSGGTFLLDIGINL